MLTGNEAESPPVSHEMQRMWPLKDTTDVTDGGRSDFGMTTLENVAGSIVDDISLHR